MADNGTPEDPLRTALAAQGVNLSALFFVVFEKTRIGGTPPRRPRLMAPTGPSTAGGRLARQHLTLEPADGASGAAVVAGWVDPAKRLAELRTFRALDEGFRERFGQELELDVKAYAQFLGDAKKFLIEQGFGITMMDRAVAGAASPAPSMSPWMILAMVLLGTLVLGIGLGAGWVLLVER